MLALAIPAMAAPAPSPSLTPGHDIVENEQRNSTPGGSGIMGGTNEYWPTPASSPKPSR